MKWIVLAGALFLATGTAAYAAHDIYGSGTGPDQAKACSAAKAKAQTMAGRKKVELGECECKPDGNQTSCTVKGTTR